MSAEQVAYRLPGGTTFAAGIKDIRTPPISEGTKISSARKPKNTPTGPPYSASLTAYPDATQHTFDDVMASVPTRDAEIDALRKKLETLQALHAATFASIEAFVACDASAISYQSLGQYRTALLKMLRQAPTGKEAGA